jgi:hypothetical protein
MKAMLCCLSTSATAPQIASEAISSQPVVLTVIETATRREISSREVENREQALAIFRAMGNGYDAHIRTPKYSELILSL